MLANQRWPEGPGGDTGPVGAFPAVAQGRMQAAGR